MRGKIRIVFTSVLVCALMLCSFTLNKELVPQVYFKVGNTLTYDFQIEKGAKRTIEIKIATVSEEKRVHLSTATFRHLDDLGKLVFTYRNKFECDSNYWFIDVINNLHVQEVDKSGSPFEITGEAIRYPLVVQVRDTLLPAFGQKTTNPGASNYEQESTFMYNRKVLKQESVTTPAGTFTAFQITYKMTRETKASYGALGTTVTRSLIEGTEWYVPAIGIVKSIQKSQFGTQTMELKSYSH